MDALRHKNSQLEQVHERLQREKQSAINELDRITVRGLQHFYFSLRKILLDPHSVNMASTLRMQAALNEERSNFLKNTDDLASKCLAVEQVRCKSSST